MQANPDKFQAIALGKKSHETLTEFNIDNNNIKCEDSVKLLGINIDFMLKLTNK